MTLRNFDDKIYNLEKRDIICKINELNKNNEAKIKVKFNYKVPAVINSPKLYEKVKNIKPLTVTVMILLFWLSVYLIFCEGANPMVY